MNGRAFLDVADELVTGAHEAHWRSAVSRAYYATFHLARALLEGCGFGAPRAETAHAYLSLRLSNCGHPDLSVVGRELAELRRERNRADYDIASVLPAPRAIDLVETAARLSELLEGALADPSLITRISPAMRDYERDVLKEVTWRGP
jgi:uncharacterized protein (UPF0332 family)